MTENSNITINWAGIRATNNPLIGSKAIADACFHRGFEAATGRRAASTYQSKPITSPVHVAGERRWTELVWTGITLLFFFLLCPWASLSSFAPGYHWIYFLHTQHTPSNPHTLSSSSSTHPEPVFRGLPRQKCAVFLLALQPECSPCLRSPPCDDESLLSAPLNLHLQPGEKEIKK